MAIAAEEPSEQVKRMDAAATVLDEVMGTPDKGIPEELLDSAKCVAVIPSMIRIGLSSEGATGEESPPAAPVLDGAHRFLSPSLEVVVRIARSYAGDREVQDRLTFQTP
jgi:hypothetical protein